MPLRAAGPAWSAGHAAWRIASRADRAVDTPVLASATSRAALRVAHFGVENSMATVQISPPGDGERITVRDGKLTVPDHPIVPFIEGDGTGPDIWRAGVRVLDAAVAKAYGARRRIHWMEVYAGEKANKLFNTWLPDETVAACRE